MAWIIAVARGLLNNVWQLTLHSLLCHPLYLKMINWIFVHCVSKRQQQSSKAVTSRWNLSPVSFAIHLRRKKNKKTEKIAHWLPFGQFNLWVNGVFGFSSFVNRNKLEKLFLDTENLTRRLTKKFFGERRNYGGLAR